MTPRAIIKKALFHHRMYEQLKDTLLSKEKVRDINEIDAKYRTAEKDRNIAWQQLKISQQQQNIERQRILVAGSVLFALLVTCMVVLIYRHKRRIARRSEEIEHLKAQMEGEENERKRIARELHDGLGGILTSARLNLDTLQHKKMVTRGDMGGIAKLLQEMGDEVHRTAHNLMPDILEEQDLWQALLVYCEQINISGKIATDVQAHGDITGIDKQIALPLYRIAQELIQNAVKHSGGSLLSVQIRNDASSGKLYLSVEDNGIGYDTAAYHSGMGLKNIRDRVNMLNGYISIESAPGMGTTVFIEIELPGVRDGQS